MEAESRANESSQFAGTTTMHCADSRLPGASERLSLVQLKPDILFLRRIIRGAVRRSRNSRVEGRVTRREVDRIRATPFIESWMLVFLTERNTRVEKLHLELTSHS